MQKRIYQFDPYYIPITKELEYDSSSLTPLLKIIGQRKTVDSTLPRKIDFNDFIVPYGLSCTFGTYPTEPGHMYGDLSVNMHYRDESYRDYPRRMEWVFRHFHMGSSRIYHDPYDRWYQRCVKQTYQYMWDEGRYDWRHVFEMIASTIMFAFAKAWGFKKEIFIWVAMFAALLAVFTNGAVESRRADQNYAVVQQVVAEKKIVEDKLSATNNLVKQQTALLEEMRSTLKQQQAELSAVKQKADKDNDDNRTLMITLLATNPNDRGKVLANSLRTRR